VAQFYATTWRSGDGFDSTLNFSIEGHRYELIITELPIIFGLAPNDFHREPISSERSISDNELTPLYFPGNENNYGTNHGILHEYYIFNNIFWNTLTLKRGDHTSIRGSIRNLLLAILDGQPLPCISVFFWAELMFVLNHGIQYAIYAPYIQRMINYKTDMEFGYDGKHGAYQPHVVQGPAVPPPPTVAAATGPSATAPASPPARAPPSAAPESSRATTHHGKKQNILVRGLKTLICMCRSNDALICESHQQMSQRLSTHEERQCEMHASMGFETPELIVYSPLPPPAMEDPWAWYRNVGGEDDNDDDEIEEESK
jgi:hypothetical protein